MLPWGHLGVGYLVYTFGTRVLLDRPPQGQPVLALALGTQAPDLIDKPLNWWFDVFDGRAVGHSLLMTIPICLLLFFIGKRYGRSDLTVAFSIGVFTHLLGDAWRPLLAGNFKPASYLLWPMFSPPTYPSDSFVDHLHQWFSYLQMVQTLSWRHLLFDQFGVQLLLAIVVFTIWALDGFPGARTIRDWIIRRR